MRQLFIKHKLWPCDYRSNFHQGRYLPRIWKGMLTAPFLTLFWSGSLLTLQSYPTIIAEVNLLRQDDDIHGFYPEKRKCTLYTVKSCTVWHKIYPRLVGHATQLRPQVGSHPLSPPRGNSRTYTYVEVSGHNLKSSQTWGFYLRFLPFYKMLFSKHEFSSLIDCFVWISETIRVVWLSVRSFCFVYTCK